MPKKLIAGGVGMIGGLEKILKINSRGRLENIYCFNFRFSNGNLCNVFTDFARKSQS